MDSIGTRVKALRLKRKLTQEQLAQAIGITQGSLSLIENDLTEVPAGSTVAGLCKALRTTAEFLIAGSGDPDSIESAMMESELVFLWRDMPEPARALMLEQAKAIKAAFGLKVPQV